MKRIFTEEALKKNKVIEINEETTHHLLHVMRLKQNDKVIAFNGVYGEWIAEIHITNKKKINLLANYKNDRKLIKPDNVILAFSLLKNQNNSLIIAKSTELNVKEIIPVIMDRTIVRDFNIKRYKKIALEATEQSGRLSLPIIHEATSLDNLLSKNINSNIIICNNQTPSENISSIIQKIDMEKVTIIIIGPEGGYSKEEIEKFSNLTYIFNASLGDLILRSETACISALSAYCSLHKSLN